MNNDSMSVHGQISLHVSAFLAFESTPINESLHLLMKGTTVYLIMRVSLGI